MSANTLFFIVIVALPLAMMFMRRGGAGMGGCCGGGSHHDHTDQKSQGPSEKPLLGPPGTQASAGPVAVPAVVKKGRHGCC